MIAIICLDEQNGMAFNHRRQSKDQEVMKDMLEESKDKLLYMNAYSYGMFKEMRASHIKVSENFLEEAGSSDFCFIEREGLLPYLLNIEKIVVYKWNRRYPTDIYLDIHLDEWKKIETKDFAGYSHERITKEIYIR